MSADRPPSASTPAGGATRRLGLALGGGGLVVALGALALRSGRPDAPPPPAPAAPAAGEPSAAAAPLLSPPPTPQAAKPQAATPQEVVAEVASAAEPPKPAAKPAPVKAAAPSAAPRPAEPNLEFIVRFRPGHPLAEAAALSGKGRAAEAEALARRTLSSRRELAGLCLEGFTMGGAEVVLRLCEPVEDRRVNAVARQWVRHLKGASGVQYVDRNVTLQPGSAIP